MASWVLKSFRLDPWSYQNLLRKTEWLRARNAAAGGRARANGKGAQPVNASVTLRYILRALRFEDGAPQATIPEARRLSLAQVRLARLRHSEAAGAPNVGHGVDGDRRPAPRPGRANRSPKA